MTTRSGWCDNSRRRAWWRRSAAERHGGVMTRFGRSRTNRILLAALLFTLASCAKVKESADQRFAPLIPGQLTVATSLPAPGFWEGDGADHVTGGFEYEMARRLAERFDLELRGIDRPFDQIVSGDLDGADVSLAQITVTDEREKRLRFSIPYYEDDAGAVIKAGEDLTDLKTAKEQRWVGQRGTVQQTIVTDQIRPDDEPLLCDEAPACIEAVASGRADAALVDLSTALVLTKGRTDVQTGAKVLVEGGFGIALPNNSDNVEVVDAAVRALMSDGTTAALNKRYLDPAFSTDAGSLPVIRLSS